MSKAEEDLSKWKQEILHKTETILSLSGLAVIDSLLASLAPAATMVTAFLNGEEMDGALARMENEMEGKLSELRSGDPNKLMISNIAELIANLTRRVCATTDFSNGESLDTSQLIIAREVSKMQKKLREMDHKMNNSISNQIDERRFINRLSIELPVAKKIKMEPIEEREPSFPLGTISVIGIEEEEEDRRGAIMLERIREERSERIQRSGQPMLTPARALSGPLRNSSSTSPIREMEGVAAAAAAAEVEEIVETPAASGRKGGKRGRPKKLRREEEREENRESERMEEEEGNETVEMEEVRNEEAESANSRGRKRKARNERVEEEEQGRLEQGCLIQGKYTKKPFPPFRCPFKGCVDRVSVKDIYAHFDQRHRRQGKLAVSCINCDVPCEREFYTHRCKSRRSEGSVFAADVTYSASFDHNKADSVKGMVDRMEKCVGCSYKSDSSHGPLMHMLRCARCPHLRLECHGKKCLSIECEDCGETMNNMESALNHHKETKHTDLKWAFSCV